MERRDWSLKVLSELNYIDSLDMYEKADALVAWYNEYFKNNSMENLELNLEELLRLEELFFRNLTFLKDIHEKTAVELKNIKKLKNFIKNQ